MKQSACLCVAAMLAASPALAGPDAGSGKPPTDAEIRSGLVVDDGLDIPRIRPGTQFFEIHGSTRIARALGYDRLPTDEVGPVVAAPVPASDPAEAVQQSGAGSDRHAAAW